jgi:hypothetical protein
MHYWNKDNFEGLKSVGEKYSSLNNYELFGKYCLQKERGLKKLANGSIRDFVLLSKNRPLECQRVIAEELSSLAFWNGEIHQLLTHPLVEYLKEILEDWATEEPTNAIPFRWLGYIGGDISSYERAIELDPKDEISISRVAQAHLNDVDYQTHHLSESRFLGDFLEAKSSLSLAHGLVSSLYSEELKLKMREELTYYSNLLDCWETYSKLDTDMSFPKWCASKGEEFNFWSIVYYDK